MCLIAPAVLPGEQPGTTQLKGVTPDIRFPSAFEGDEFGETRFDNALPWRQIDPATYRPANEIRAILPELTSRHATRANQDKAFADLREDVAELIKLKEKRNLSLQEAERKREKDSREARLRARAETDGTAGPGDDGLQTSERSLSAGTSCRKKPSRPARTCCSKKPPASSATR